MSADPTDYYGLQVAAALDGDNIALRIRRDAAARAVAADTTAAPLAQVLARAAVGALRADEAALLIRHSEPMRQAALDLSGAQAGDVTVGAVAGGDIVTINVYVGNDHGRYPSGS